MTPNTRTARPQKTVYRLWRGTHIMIWRVLNYTIEIHKWNQAGKNNNIALSGTPSQPQTALGMLMSLRKSLLQLLRMYLSQQYVYNYEYRLRSRTNLIHYIRHNDSPPVCHVISKTRDKNYEFTLYFCCGGIIHSIGHLFVSNWITWTLKAYMVIAFHYKLQ